MTDDYSTSISSVVASPRNASGNVASDSYLDAGGVQSTVLPGIEFNASEIRQIFQGLFPHRRLVLSQFTFFNNAGIAQPTGLTQRRGRRCYRTEDLLSIAAVLALKEEGIPLKNIQPAPGLIRDRSEEIFSHGAGVRVSGCGSSVQLSFGTEAQYAENFIDFLLNADQPSFFWSYDVGSLALSLLEVTTAFVAGEDLQKFDGLDTYTNRQESAAA